MSVLSSEQVARYCHDAGFFGESLVTAVAIAKAESGFDTDAVGDKGLVDAVWGPSVGLFQIRSLHAERGTGSDRDELANFDPGHNASAAWAISSHGTAFWPWSVYGSGAYRRHLDAVRPACAVIDPTVSIDGWRPEEPVLRIGHSGPAVVELQRRLTAAGFPCTPDGQFGPKTRRAVFAFQASRRLLVDGIVGPQTWSALRRETAAPTVGGG